MLMHYCQFYVFVFLALAITNINTSIPFTDQQSLSIPLKAPKLSGNYPDNRPPLPSSVNINEKQNEIKLITSTDDINLCNGSYIKTNGTTCGLKEIMIGRCYEYQYIKRGLYLSNKTEIKNCTELYELFESAVRYKPYCNMNMSTYEAYFQYALDGVHVINRAMFWSGTYPIAHAYSGHGVNYITLEDTLAAAMADGLMWCGKANDTEGFDYLSCPNNCKDNIWADSAFWGLASRTFAEKVTGEIYVVINGSRAEGRPSFRNDSYFARFELPNLQREGPYRVTKINVLLLHTPDQAVVEKCGEKSLIILENLVRSYQIDYTCKDDPEELILIMCAEEWEARECQIAREVLREEWNKKVFGKSTTIYHSTSFFILFCLFISYRSFLSDFIEL